MSIKRASTVQIDKKIYLTWSTFMFASCNSTEFSLSCGDGDLGGGIVGSGGFSPTPSAKLSKI